VVEFRAHAIEKKGQVLENTIRETAQDIKDQLKRTFKATAKGVQRLEKTVLDEADDIKDKLEKMHRSMERLSSSFHSSGTSLASQASVGK